MEKQNHFLIFRKKSVDLNKLTNSSIYKSSIYISDQTHMPKEGVNDIVSNLADLMAHTVPSLEILNYIDEVCVIYVPNQSMLSPVALICESHFDLIKISEKNLIEFLDLIKEYFYLHKISHSLIDVEAYSQAYDDNIQKSNLPKDFDYEKNVIEKIDFIREKTDEASDILLNKILGQMILNE